MSKSIFSFAAVAAISLFGCQFGQAQQTTQRPPAPQIRQNVQNAQSSQGGVTVQEAIAKKFMKANEAEIELAKMAQEKTDNKDLRQLTEMLVKDHQALNAELKKYCDMASAKQGATAQTTAGQSQPLGSTQTRNASVTNNQQNQQSTGDMYVALVPRELCEVGEQACENSLKMTKEMLGKYEGQDFEMAFLGQQCFVHTCMLAELKAVESVGPQELRELCRTAIPKVEQHLEKVKTLAKNLKDDDSKSND